MPAALLVSVAAAVSCAAPPAPAVRTTTPAVAVTFGPSVSASSPALTSPPESERLAAPLTDENDSLQPPPENAAAIPIEAAHASVAGDVDATYTPYLALYSSIGTGQIDPNGSVTPRFTDKLVWAFISHKPYTPIGGPAPQPGQPPPTIDTATMRSCVHVWLVDATDAASLGGWATCTASPKH